MAVAAMVGRAMVLTITYDALARYLFAAPTDWAYPLNAAGVLAATVLAIPHLYATGGHIALDLVHRGLSPRARRVADAGRPAGRRVPRAGAGGHGGALGGRGLERGLTGAGTFSIPLLDPRPRAGVSGVFLVVAALLFPPHPARRSRRPRCPAAGRDRADARRGADDEGAAR